MLAAAGQASGYFPHGHPAQGWSTLPIGDGGALFGMQVSDNGFAAGACVHTDVGGGYVWDNANQQWDQVCTGARLGSTRSAHDFGCWELVGCPTAMTNLYMVYGDLNNAPGATTSAAGLYRVYTSTNYGGSWTRSSLAFSIVTNFWLGWGSGFSLTNGSAWRGCAQKIAVDPANPLVAYVGLPIGAVLYGPLIGQSGGVARTLDGGATWSLVPGIPAPTAPGGAVGLRIDPHSGTTTLSGITVTNNILLPIAGQGIFFSSDGGNTFTQVTSDATPSTTISYTTSQANSIIVVQIASWNQGGVASVTSPGLTFQQRGSAYGNRGYGAAFVYWAIAATAGTYTITVDYEDGNYGYQPNTPSIVTSSVVQTTGSNTITIPSPPSNFATGMGLTGVSGCGTDSVATGTFSQAYLTGGNDVSGWIMNMVAAANGTVTATGKPRQTNYVNVFAVSGADQTNPFGTGKTFTGFIDDGSGSGTPSGIAGNILTITSHSSITVNPYSSLNADFFITGVGVTAGTKIVAGLLLTNLTSFIVNNTQLVGSSTLSMNNPIENFSSPSITTTATAMVFSHGCGQLVVSATPVSGFTVMEADTVFNNFYTVSSAGLAAGTYTPGANCTWNGDTVNITDALYQASGKTIALDGTPQYVTSGPSLNLQPVQALGSYMDFSGNLYVYESPPRARGGIWRGTAASSYATWQRIDGTPNYTMANLSPSDVTSPVCGDKRSGGQDIVYINIDHGYSGVQATNATASPNAINWSAGNSSGTQTPNITCTRAPWLAINYASSGPGAQYDMDPTTGTFYGASGKGVWALTTFNIRFGTFSVLGQNLPFGIEETILGDICTPPNTSSVLIGLEDEELVVSDGINYPTSKQPSNPNDSDCWAIDFAKDNPNFVVAWITGFSQAQDSCFGVLSGGTWTFTNFSTFPTHATTGGSIACASVGTDGLSTSNKTAKIVVIPTATATPQFTIDNGSGTNGGWQACTFHGITMPKTFFATSANLAQPTLLTAADDNGTYYLYYPGTGASPSDAAMFYSTDNGANFFKSNPSGLKISNNGNGGYYVIKTVPGYPGHVWAAASNGTTIQNSVFWTTDGTGGAGTLDNWNALLDPSSNPITSFGFAIGRSPAPGSLYPSIYIQGIIPSIDPANVKFYRGDCLGNSPSLGFNWTLLGDLSTISSASPNAVIPIVGNPVTMLWGDWNRYGRLYINWSECGAQRYSL